MNVNEFEAEVATVVGSLPVSISAEMDNVVIEVSVHQPNNIEGPLLGLYEGVPLPERGFDYFAVAPDRIQIFYAAHMTLGLPDGELRDEIRRTVLHEIGHHLGITDTRLAELGWD